jgi:carbamoyl-phosphate synthase/aspartate carbamoyltransferase/dihydroorotase
MQITWPGLIDVHVHLREPGAEYKEDFLTGSEAALAGGLTYILDMPNNSIPTISLAALKQKISLAKKAKCAVGFHFGTNGKNLDQFAAASNHSRVFGLKIYLNHTTGEILIEDESVLEKIFAAWQSDKPILVHAEGGKLLLAISLAKKFNRRLHVCHISLKEEVEWVEGAKKSGQKITAGVTPHHLFLQPGDARMKPPLVQDQESLWQGLNDGTIDLIESDHAPHLKEEKLFGVPGLETTLGLMLLGVKQKKCTLDQVKTWLYDNPKQIFNIPDQKSSIKFNPDKEWVVDESKLKTKCGWSPFSGRRLYGKVEEINYGRS